MRKKIGERGWMESLIKVTFQSKETLMAIIFLCPKEKRADLILKKHFGMGCNLLHQLGLYNDIQSCIALFEMVPEDRHLEMLHQKTITGEPILHLVIKSPNFVKLILTLCPPAAQIALYKEQCNKGRTILHKAAGCLYSESLAILLEAIPSDKRVGLLEQVDNDGQTVVQAASRKSESLKIILGKLNQEERLFVLDGFLYTLFEKLKDVKQTRGPIMVVLQALSDTQILSFLNEKTVGYKVLLAQLFDNADISVNHYFSEAKSPLLKLLVDIASINKQEESRKPGFFEGVQGRCVRLSVEKLVAQPTTEAVYDEVIAYLNKGEKSQYKAALLDTLLEGQGLEVEGSCSEKTARLEKAWLEDGLYQASLPLYNRIRS